MDGSLIDRRSGCDREAIAARTAEINGMPQRIEPLASEELSAESRDLIHRLGASVGTTGDRENTEYFRTMLKHPELFRRQLEMGLALFTGRLPPRERELAVLRIAWLMQAPYEWGEHVLIGKRCGLTPEEIERVVQGAGAPGWSEADAAILCGVEELLSRQAISDGTWATLAKTWDEPQLIEFSIMVGQYVATAMVQNALRMRLTGENPGLTHR
ncbi:carboxymuconolactone decarboxylase family protein [Phenylobacterium sp. LjRoot225]|uniref:carboxymuconolactone decarboxylase family protein n=1 Tax=Phenylobacterium sp. LjRoot225 TaxID=3342285 RepID=UPI003ED13E78